MTCGECGADDGNQTWVSACKVDLPIIGGVTGTAVQRNRSNSFSPSRPLPTTLRHNGYGAWLHVCRDVSTDLGSRRASTPSRAANCSARCSGSACPASPTMLCPAALPKPQLSPQADLRAVRVCRRRQLDGVPRVLPVGLVPELGVRHPRPGPPLRSDAVRPRAAVAAVWGQCQALERHLLDIDPAVGALVPGDGLTGGFRLATTGCHAAIL